MASTTTTKRFEFVGGGSDKFWEITTRGTEVSVRFGRNGTQGQTTTRAFPDAAAARHHADKLIREKTGKGADGRRIVPRRVQKLRPRRRTRMAIVSTRPGPNGRARPSLGDQLDRLDGILNGLSDALNESVTAAVSAAVGKVVREAVESAAREMSARYIPKTAEHAPPELPGRRPSRRLTGRWQAQTRRVFMQAGRLLPRLGSPLVASARQVSRAPGRFAAWALAGILAGAAAGVGGPLVGAAMGAVAGFAFAHRTTRPS